ncbi:hypothetical protein [Cryptosporangium japonicum]
MGQWVFDDGDRVSPGSVARAIHRKIARGRAEIWLTSTSACSLGLITDGVRARLLRRDGPHTPERVAYDQIAAGPEMPVFQRADGKEYEYPVAETIHITQAVGLISQIVMTGNLTPTAESDLFWWPPDESGPVGRN